MDQSSYSIGQFHYQSNGYRANSDLENNLYNLFVQTAITPDFNLQAEYRSRETITGDPRSNFDGSFRSTQRRTLDQDIGRLGARYSLSPQTNIIASVMYAASDDSLEFKNNPDYNLSGSQKGYLAETQLLYKSDFFNLVTGVGAYSIDNNFSNNEQPNTTDHQEIVYSYANFKLPENLILTVGLSYESDDTSNARFDELNPKLGLQWMINNHVSLRAAAFQTVNRGFTVDQTIEPTQVAGFNQLYDNGDSTISKNYGIGLDVRLNNRLFGGLEALRRDNEVPFGAVDEPAFYLIEHNQENFYSAYINWMPSHRLAFSIVGRYEKFAEQDCIICQPSLMPAQLRTITLPLNIQYFDPSGFFAGLGIVYVNQDIQLLDASSLVFLPPTGPGLPVIDPGSVKFLPDSEKFTLINVGLGYRLPKRQGIISLEARNVFDQQFRFQDYSFMSADQVSNPLYLPERTFFGRFVLNF